MSQKLKTARTQIADLPEVAVEMSDQDMQSVSGGLSLVSGGLKSKTVGCNSRVMLASSSGLNGTNVITNGDWDTD